MSTTSSASAPGRGSDKMTEKSPEKKKPQGELPTGGQHKVAKDGMPLATNKLQPFAPFAPTVLVTNKLSKSHSLSSIRSLDEGGWNVSNSRVGTTSALLPPANPSYFGIQPPPPEKKEPEIAGFTVARRAGKKQHRTERRFVVGVDGLASDASSIMLPSDAPQSDHFERFYAVLRHTR